MELKKYNLKDFDKKLGETYWSPEDVVCVNDQVLRIAAIKGEYHWHSHQEDELFVVFKGKIIIDTEFGSIELNEGECFVVHKGIQHRPKATDRAVILMFEPSTLESKGD